SQPAFRGGLGLRGLCLTIGRDDVEPAVFKTDPRNLDTRFLERLNRALNLVRPEGLNALCHTKKTPSFIRFTYLETRLVIRRTKVKNPPGRKSYLLPQRLALSCAARRHRYWANVEERGVRRIADMN